MLYNNEIDSVVLEKKIFFKMHLFFLQNVNWPFIFAIYICLSIKMLCFKFGLNWPSSFGEEVENVKI